MLPGAANSLGWLHSMLRRPAPGHHLAACGLPPALPDRPARQGSCRPHRRIPAIANGSDSADAQRRRLRSPKTGATATYFATIVASKSTSRCMRPVDQQALMKWRGNSRHRPYRRKTGRVTPVSFSPLNFHFSYDARTRNFT